MGAPDRQQSVGDNHPGWRGTGGCQFAWRVSLRGLFSRRKMGLWAGVTVAVHPTNIPYVRSAFELVDDSMARLILPDEARLLSSYRDDSEWAWLEVRWITTEGTRMQPGQTNQALWDCLKKSFKRRQQVVVLALEDLDYMAKEVGPKFQLAPLTSELRW